MENEIKQLQDEVNDLNGQLKDKGIEIELLRSEVEDKEDDILEYKDTINSNVDAFRKITNVINGEEA